MQLFAAQMGQTEVAAGKAPYGVSTLPAGSTGYTNGLPLGNDANPPPATLPWITSYSGTAQQVISVASLPVLLNSAQDAAAVASGVTGLIPDDMAQEAHTGNAIPWAWYEEGATTGSGAPSAAFSAHHDAPLYFDYVNNAKSAFGTPSTILDNTYGGKGLLQNIRGGYLQSEGVYWVKGAAGATSFPFRPADSALTAAGTYLGTDDHPGSGSSDHQVSEAYVATLINAIAASKYWKDSVIILTWDDSGGLYDHLPPTEFGGVCPDDQSGTFAGEPCGNGVRLPMLVISPFAKSGFVVHDPSNTGSVSKFIEAVFALPTLASLPDEAAGVTAGLAPADANAAIGDLTGALELGRLNGSLQPLPASYATIASPSVPPSMSCATLGLTPIGSPAAIPNGFFTAGAYVSGASGAPAGRVRSIKKPDDDGD